MACNESRAAFYSGKLEARAGNAFGVIAHQPTWTPSSRQQLDRRDFWHVVDRITDSSQRISNACQRRGKTRWHDLDNVCPEPPGHIRKNQKDTPHRTSHSRNTLVSDSNTAVSTHGSELVPRPLRHDRMTPHAATVSRREQEVARVCQNHTERISRNISSSTCHLDVDFSDSQSFKMQLRLRK